MRALALPLFLLFPVTGALAVLMAGQDGAGIAALLGVFLVGFGFLLFRRSGAMSPGGVRLRSPGREADGAFLGFVFLAALLARVVIAMGLRHTGANEVIAPDEYTFHSNALYFRYWLAGDLPTPFSPRWAGSTEVGYFAAVGTLYSVFGTFTVVPVLMNCLLGALCAFPAYRIGAHVGGRAAGRLSAVLVVFFPSLVLWSTLLIRDAAALLLVLWCVSLAQDLLRKLTVRTLVLLLVCLALFATLRSYLFVLLVCAIVVGFVVAGARRPGRALVTALAAGLGVLLMMKGFGLGTDHLGEASLERIAMRRNWNAFGPGGGGFAVGDYDLSTPTGALTYLPIGLVWFLFSPFPWQSGGRQLMALPDVLLWYVTVPVVVIGLVYGLRRRRRSALIPLLVAVFFTLLFSLVEGNVGIIFRHRANVLVLLLPFAAVGITRLRARAAASRVAMLRPWALPAAAAVRS